MAHKASTILSINLETDRVTVQPYGWNRDRTDRFTFLAKVDRIQTLKAMGVTFQGSPMHRKDNELQAFYEKQKELLLSNGVTVIEVGSRPTPQPEPPKVEKEKAPMPTQPRTTEGGLDGALRAIVEAVIGDFVPELPKDEIEQVVL
jgi:hypothetical protein